jgi:hypothetical protein
LASGTFSFSFYELFRGADWYFLDMGIEGLLVFLEDDHVFWFILFFIAEFGVVFVEKFLLQAFELVVYHDFLECFYDFVELVILFVCPSKV